MTDRAVVYLPPLDRSSEHPPGGLLQRLLGVTPLERNLMALKRAGIDTVHLVGGGEEARAIATDLAGRGDARLPALSLGPPADTPPGLVLLDARRLFHPDLVRDAAAASPGVVYVTATGEPAGIALAPPGTLATSPVEPGYWAQAVETASDRRIATQLLLASLVKPTDGWVSRRLNRPLSTRISAVLAAWSCSPDLITLLTLVVAVLSAVSSARGTYAGFALGGVLFQLASVLDGVDGEVARLTFRASAHGQWLDTVCDDLANVVYFVGLTIGVSAAWPVPALTWLGVVTVGLDIVTVGLLYWLLVAHLGERSLLAFETRLKASAPPSGWRAAAARLQPLAKRDTYALLIMLAGLAGIPWLTLLVTPVVVVSAFVMGVRMAAGLRRRPASDILPS